MRGCARRGDLYPASVAMAVPVEEAVAALATFSLEVRDCCHCARSVTRLLLLLLTLLLLFYFSTILVFSLFSFFFFPMVCQCFWLVRCESMISLKLRWRLGGNARYWNAALVFRIRILEILVAVQNWHAAR